MPIIKVCPQCGDTGRANNALCSNLRCRAFHIRQLVDLTLHDIGMDSRAKDHLVLTLTKVATSFTLKYEQGQAEHGGNLGDKLEDPQWRKANTTEEILDLLAYHFG